MHAALPHLTHRLPHKLPRLLALALIGLCLCGSSWAQWKWRDAQGKLQFSDLPPPPGVAEKDILQRPPGFKPPVVIRPVQDGDTAPAKPAAAMPAAASGPDPRAEARRKEEQALAERQKQEEKRLAEARADNCRRAKQQLRLLEDGVRITMPNERGENVILDEAARERELRHTRAVVASDCN